MQPARTQRILRSRILFYAIGNCVSILGGHKHEKTLVLQDLKDYQIVRKAMEVILNKDR